ncbi:MAG: AMP-binding protein [Anaerolineales bacterium]
MSTLSEPTTLIEMLDRQRHDRPDQIAFTFAGKPVVYRDLWARIERAATALRSRGVGKNDYVAMALGNGPEFFSAFYGVQRAGGTAVPLFPGSGPARLWHVVEHCQAKALVVADRERAQAVSSVNAAQAVSVLTTADLAGSGRPTVFPEIDPDTPSYVQYTSGSTGSPKGVILTHRNLLTNAHQMIEGMEITRKDIFVSWLPVYHDMGLILKTIVPFALGAITHLLPTQLTDIRLWFNTIQQERATFTAAPDFAYRLANHRYSGAANCDLGSLRVALNAAEPVRARTLEAFHDTFNLERVMVAGYGLAEATVGVSMWPPGTENKIDADGFVSVGGGFPGVEIGIQGDGRALPADEIGEIMVRSPANTAGYLNAPEQTEALQAPGGFVHTGDLGYLDEDGDLFVVGRLKNTVKLAGRTLYPVEVEEILDPLDAVRLAAAIGIDRGGLQGEQLYVMCELRRPGQLTEEHGRGLVLRIVNEVHEGLGVRPARVFLLAPHTIPRTHSGKIQHNQLRSTYLDGSLRGTGAILYPAW